MIENANKILVRLSYSHIPPRCRKARSDSFHLYADSMEEAREKLYKEAGEICKKSKRVIFSKKMTFQPARVDGCVREFALFAIAGMDGCTEEVFEIGKALEECYKEAVA